MLFHVQIEVRIPPHVDRETVERLGKLEHERAAELQRAGKWKHLWRIVGRFSNISIFEVDPYMNVEVAALCRHPEAIAASS